MPRAVVLLAIPPATPIPRSRKESVAHVKSAAAELLPHIDALLREAGGTRLSETPDPLGSITVDAPRESLDRLRASPHVRAVMEDQGLSKLE